MKLKNIKINSCGKVHCRPDWYWDTGKFKDYDLWSIFGGRGKLLDCETGIEYELSAGDCFVLQKGNHYIGTTDLEDPLIVIYVHFDFKREKERPSLYRKIGNIQFFESILDRVVLRFIEGNKEESELWLNSAFAEIFGYDNIQTDFNHNVSKLSLMIDRLKTEILEYPERDHSLKLIAADAGFCRDYFSKVFKRSCGIPFMDFLMKVRIEKAKYLLRCTTLKITEIAALSGYSDIYLFSKQFKHKTGISPSLYRSRR